MQTNQIIESNKVRRDEATCRTKAAIEEMQARGERISFYSVAKRAQVARSTLYRRLDLKKLVEAARAGEESSFPDMPDASAKIAELEGELARIQQERDELREAMDEIRPVNYHLTRMEAVAQLALLPPFEETEVA